MIDVVATKKQFQSGRLQAVGDVFMVPEDRFNNKMMKRVAVKKEIDGKADTVASVGSGNVRKPTPGKKTSTPAQLKRRK